ncbi:helix-turn-helix transcriptional regulator [Nocardia sp. NPDC046763]|uniref:helix-turn-helix domain-containing protein n=1 Tax=Nocardia sp. NPDC046763 TaxID=3155256 RepID=UPI0033FC6696
MGRSAIGPSGVAGRAVSREIRAELGRRSMSQNELARAAGLGPTYLNERLRDDRPLNVNDLEAIGRVLGWSMVALLRPADEALVEAEAAREGVRSAGAETFTGEGDAARAAELQARTEARQRNA